MVPIEHSRTLVMGLALAALAAAGCPGTQDGKNVDTVDVAAGLEVPTDSDPKAPPEIARLTGALPSDFPRDLPVHLPASVLDFGTGADGLRWVSLISSDGGDRVRTATEARLRAAGWSLSESGGALVVRKGERRARLLLEEARPGTLMRYEY